MIDQTAFTMFFFESHPGVEFDSYDAEERLRRAWLEVTGERYRDPGRKLRDLREQGYLEARTVDKVLHYQLAKPYKQG